MQVAIAESRTEWNEFVERHGGPIFALWEWAELCGVYGHERHYLIARDGGESVGVLPLVHMRSRLFGTKLVSMPFSEYGSAVIAPDAPPETLSRLLDRTATLADELGVDFVSLRGHETDEPAETGFVRRTRFVTFDIPLAGTDACWDMLDSSRRTHVRNASKSGVTIRTADSLDDLREYYRLYLLSMRGHGSPPHSFTFFRRLWDLFGDTGRMRIAFAEADGHVINGTIRFPFSGTVYGWGAVSDYEYRDMNGGSLLQWKELERGCEEGYDVYTFGRTREGSGVSSFKKSFGGEKRALVDYHYFPRDEVELPDADQSKYEAVKRVWRRLPLSVTRATGPAIRKQISL